jgi:hypothetical protein
MSMNEYVVRQQDDLWEVCLGEQLVSVPHSAGRGGS